MVVARSKDDCPTLLVWDHEGQPPEGGWIPVLWREYGNAEDAFAYSIPKRVEEQAASLRTRYLAWIHDMGENRTQGVRLLDQLTLRSGFSYWWMTLPAAVSFGGSTAIYKAVRMLALEGLAGELSARKIVLGSGDESLAGAIRSWCRTAGLAFEWRRLDDASEWRSIGKRIYRSLPHPIQAATFLLRYLIQRWPLKQSGNSRHSALGGTITFVDYLIHLNHRDVAAGQFGSLYWANLISALQGDSTRVNWLHHYISHAVVPSARNARDLIGRFNQNGAGIQFHTVLDGALSWSTIKGAIRDYCRLALANLRLRKVHEHFQPASSNINFWSFFKWNWRSSMVGDTAMSNCLFLNLFEHALKRLPHQELGVYLMENQPWEMAFIYAWKAAGHGRLIGAPHSTVLYWDMRYFFDPRSYQRSVANDLPLPDQVALNGPAVINAFRNGAFPEDKIVAVEALRYLFLIDQNPASTRARTQAGESLCVLILSDYFPAITRQQMQWLSDAAPALPPDTRYVVKPHPSHPVRASDYPLLKMQITAAPIAELLNDCDVAFTSNLTSAAVDAYCAGVPIVSALDGNAFNMSPLRDLPGVTYVTGPDELAQALRQARKNKPAATEAYFCLDRKIPRWRRLLGLHQEKPRGIALH